MNKNKEIQKHERFVKVIKDYIRECMKEQMTPYIILQSFKKWIDEVGGDLIKEAKK